MPLYVFLHGLTVVADRGTELLVVLPKVPGHVYKAGSWLAETDIAPGSKLRLLGVKAGNVTFAQKGFCIYLPDSSLTTRKRAASLWLPRPKEILGLQLTQNTPYVARTKRSGPSGILMFNGLSSVNVLVYDYADENEVRLEGHYWETCSTGGSTSLHIISTSEEPEGQEHEGETDDVLNEVLRDYPGIEFWAGPRPLSAPFVALQRPMAAPWVDPLGSAGSPFGILRTPNVQLHPKGEHIVEVQGDKLAFALAELEHPTLRLLRLGRLGRLKRGKLPIENLWRDPDPIFERLCNCGTLRAKH